MTERPVTVAVIGYGLRGRDYTRYALLEPGKMQVVALADTDSARLEDGMRRFSLTRAQLFLSADELLARPRLADIAFITTQDRQHVPMALKALKAGYDLLVEKPVSPDLGECLKLEETAKRLDRRVTVCHVMRYSRFYRQIKQAIEQNMIGDVQSIMALENVGYFHQAHSFVRGNWRKTADASPMILAKCCHDFDLLLWLMDKKCTRVSSFGSLNYFKKECAPKGAALRCLGGCACKDACPYDAEKIYVYNYPTGILANAWRWPCSAITEHPDADTVYQALREGPYGRCVFYCDNDAVDHQVVNMEFEDRSTASLTMCAFTNSDERTVKVMGTMGDIMGDLSTNIITIQPFGKEKTVIDLNAPGETDGHSGGDMSMIGELIDSYRSGRVMQTALDQSIDSHVAALAAEESRLNGGKSILLDDFRAACMRADE